MIAGPACIIFSAVTPYISGDFPVLRLLIAFSNSSEVAACRVSVDESQISLMTSTSCCSEFLEICVVYIASERVYFLQWLF